MHKYRNVVEKSKKRVKNNCGILWKVIHIEKCQKSEKI